jgi:hypothetical protein
VVGSALVAEIEKADTPDAAAAAVGEKIRSLKEAARRGVSKRGEPDAPAAEAKP